MKPSRPTLRFAVVLMALVPCACGSSTSSTTSAPGNPITLDGGSDAPPGAPTSGSFVPTDVPIATSAVIAMRFTDEKNGFLLLNGETPETRGVWATADAGETWAKRAVDISPTGLAFTPDLSRVWLVGRNAVSSLWSSLDRGVSFAPLPWDHGGTGAVALVDASTALVTSFAGGDDLFRTADGGKTWGRQQELEGASHHIAVLGQDVWLAGGLGRKADTARVAHSTDAGATFTITPLTDKAHTFEGGSLRALAAVSKTEVWVAGDSRQVFHSTDAGTQWLQIKGIPDTVESFGGIDVRGSRVTLAASSTNGYALYVSDDSGATFRLGPQIRCPSRCGLVTGIASPRAGLLYIYGDRFLWRVVES